MNWPLTEQLSTGWQVASTSESRSSPADLDGLHFIPAEVPGTVASALRSAKQWHPGTGQRFDNAEHWFRCQFDSQPAESGEHLHLHFGGIATIADVWLNGQPILSSDSMFKAHDVDVRALVHEQNELVIAYRSLTTALTQRRRAQPTARWRTRVVAEQQLRWYRTTILGRAPGFAPEPEPVGPWRPISLVRSPAVIYNWTRRTSADGTVEIDFDIEGAQPTKGMLHVGTESRELIWISTHATCRLKLRDFESWWPHTHGNPVLYPVHVTLEFADGSTLAHEDPPVGFRGIDAGRANPTEEGLALHVNGVEIFCRGVVWTPLDIVSLQANVVDLRQRLELLRHAGINLIRVVGTAHYESETFHRLCDELGLLVWQDMMFANMDYPFADGAFHTKVIGEAETQLDRLRRHASTAVICGNSEIEQQAAMLGLEPNAGRAEFFATELPAIANRRLPGVPYLPSAPCGGTLPFRTDAGVANYFGVGAYLRPLEDARHANVRFASECLAFSNVPEPEAIDEMAAATPGGISLTHPAWKRGVPRDAGVGWDFEDVRDHYLKLLYGVDPMPLRYASMDRYFDLSRMVSGEVMAEVFGEWRRAASPCAGGIILWCADLTPGAGWGILDSGGRPKAAYWFLKRALASIAVWMTDEGLNGIAIHIANDGPESLNATLRIGLYQHGERRVGDGSRAIQVEAHTTAAFDLEAILGRFADAAYAYRFGPPAHDLIVASLSIEGTETPISQSFRFPARRTAVQEPIDRLGLAGRCTAGPDGKLHLSLQATRFAWGTRITARGFTANDQYFGLEPGVRRQITLKPIGTPKLGSIAITAINAEGRVVIPVEPGV